MYEPKEKIKFNVSKSLKDLNKRYHRNYTVQDIADFVGVSRETISRLSSFSGFNLVYAVASCLYEFYPEYNNSYWDFATYANLLSWDDCSFIL